MEGHGRRPRSSNWDALMDRILIDLMLKEQQRINYPGVNFNIHSWTLLSSAFNSASGYSLTSYQVKDHWRLLKTKYKLYVQLLKLSGWGWDPINNIPIPGYDGAWEEVIKVIENHFL
ncbi:hypothetical protein Taro_047983 [Colocasia esculenta]|uniref:Myb/SANT-like domain-containing protein n=1 Tax=Colocasia esculenta TaxID=4460 RepID=A0A843X7K7_COLES|nr:hypothetical protein [Colocasia esculenta]